jgi:hypothetical protein
MAILSGLAGWPLARLGRSPRAFRWITLATGALSLGFGIYWGIPLIARLAGA